MSSEHCPGVMVEGQLNLILRHYVARWLLGMVVNQLWNGRVYVPPRHWSLGTTRRGFVIWACLMERGWECYGCGQIGGSRPATTLFRFIVSACDNVS